MKILLQTIPHENQRYSTCGDWFYDNEGTLIINVSEVGNRNFEFLVALHELVEVQLCSNRGVTAEQVDEFDMQFEAARKEGDESEPGDSPQAPYRREHFHATNIERLVAEQLGVDWAEYEKQIGELP